MRVIIALVYLAIGSAGAGLAMSDPWWAQALIAGMWARKWAETTSEMWKDSKPPCA